MEMTISVRSPQDVYEAFIAEFDNAQQEDCKLPVDMANSERLKQWVTDAVHEIYCLGVSDGADYLDADAVRGYAVTAAINTGIRAQQIVELVDALTETMDYITVPEARQQYQDGNW